MKTLIAVIVVLSGMALTAPAQANDKLTLRPGQQVTAKKSKLKVKFVSVLEDSRCPVGVNCVWAGNAKIRIEVTSRRLGKKVFEINTTAGPQGDQFDGWAINLTGLTPHPTANGGPVASRYRATFTITKLSR